jgi:hypothetical protein
VWHRLLLNMVYVNKSRKSKDRWINLHLRFYFCNNICFVRLRFILFIYFWGGGWVAQSVVFYSVLCMLFCSLKPEYPERTIYHGQATGKLYHLWLRVECTLFCNLQSRARTHAVLIGLYELLGNPATYLIEPPGG